jgi:hypothetical protein
LGALIKDLTFKIQDWTNERERTQSFGHLKVGSPKQIDTNNVSGNLEDYGDSRMARGCSQDSDFVQSQRGSHVPPLCGYAYSGDSFARQLRKKIMPLRAPLSDPIKTRSLTKLCLE